MTGEEQSEEITSEEKALLEHYRKLSEKEKAEINGIIELKLKNVTIETQVINSKVGQGGEENRSYNFNYSYNINNNCYIETV